MKCSDRTLLTGAWVAIVAAGAFSIYRVSESPRIDPSVEKLCRDLEKAQKATVTCRETPRPPIIVIGDPDPWRAGFITPSEEQNRFHTTLVGRPVLPKDRDILVLPFPAMDSAKADLDGASITWKTVLREVEHKPWMHPKEAKPSGFTVYRESTLGQPEKIAELGPAARSFTDLSTEPRKTYTYWVTLTGLETDRSNNDGNLMSVTNKADRPAKATAPVATRLKMVGGDQSHAVLRLETYDRAKKSWVPKTFMAAPGELLAGTGWSLKGMRFENFTLVADVTDDDGAARVLSTRD